MLKAKLIVVGGDAKRTEVPLKKLPSTIGRAREATITLPHSLVSRKHCEIFQAENQLHVRDLDSLNGTYLNNERVVGSAPILPGQLLTLGNVTFRADYQVVDELIDHDSTDQVSAGQTQELKDDETVDVDFESPIAAPPNAIESAPNLDSESVISPEQIVFENNREPSICLGAIQELPPTEQKESFKGVILGQSKAQPNLETAAIEIDSGDGFTESADPNESALNDFFRKNPK